MAQEIQLPCDLEGVCMKCKAKPLTEDTLTCGTCTTPWHATCLAALPESLASTLQWKCPDCSDLGAVAAAVGGSSLVAAIREIEADASLTEKEKAKRRLKLHNGMAVDDEEDEEEEEKQDGKGKEVGGVMDVLDASFQCSFCMLLPDRPVTTPCGHNFCLKCFQRWLGQGNRTCVKCRSVIPQKMASQPRINASLVAAIRLAKMSKSAVSGGLAKVYHFVHNQHKPEKAYTTERAQKAGKANACSGKIFVTVAPDHFGPIPAENDPERNQGVLVGECWEDRLECRQWGAHLPHVAGIAGQSNYGAQSVALSGGYLDDEDHGEWFLYTGSGGRDLSGNKRTNKEQSFDQKFENYNEALRVSCKKGYPVRVVRSHKEKRSSYAPEKGVRYDGVYRIEKCWRKVRNDGFKICRYLFVRCDNEPAPWTSDERGDVPRPLPKVAELKKAVDITERKESPAWDFDEKDSSWKWTTPPPASRKAGATVSGVDRKRSRKAQNLSDRERILRGFSCLICRKVMNKPVTTPCAHNFCQSCLVDAFQGQTGLRDRNRGGRTLRAQKNVLKCPECPTDIADFLQNPKVNNELQSLIESLQSKAEVEEEPEENEDGEEKLDVDEGDGSMETEAEVNDLSVMTESGVNKKRKIEATDPSVDADQHEKVVPPKDGRVKQLTPEVGADVEGNDSPLSTLQVRSSDDDLE